MQCQFLPRMRASLFISFYGKTENFQCKFMMVLISQKKVSAKLNSRHCSFKQQTRPNRCTVPENISLFRGCYSIKIYTYLIFILSIFSNMPSDAQKTVNQLLVKTNWRKKIKKTKWNVCCYYFIIIIIKWHHFIYTLI